MTNLNKIADVEGSKFEAKNVFFIEAETSTDWSYYVAGLRHYWDKIQSKKKGIPNDFISNNKIIIVFKSSE